MASGPQARRHPITREQAFFGVDARRYACCKLALAGGPGTLAVPLRIRPEFLERQVMERQVMERQVMAPVERNGTARKTLDRKSVV